MQSFIASRGGAKPRMLGPTSQDVLLTIGNGRKGGIYELSSTAEVLARRVELPTWLSADWERVGGDIRSLVYSARRPAYVTESKGHIFLNPPADLFSGPAVGLDLEIYNILFKLVTVRAVSFYIYATDYRLAGVWAIERDDFITRSKRVQTKPQFMPQMMVRLQDLTVVGAMKPARAA